ncbi:Microtubule-associated protein 4, partial [Galemys pyrenaicus]
SPIVFLEEKMAYQGHQNNQGWPENTNFCFEPEQVVNPNQIDPLRVLHDDPLSEFLFLPGGTANASTLSEQSDSLKNTYGLFPCDTFTPERWSVEAPNSPRSESFTSPEVITQPLQPTAVPFKEVEMASAEERTPTEALEITMGLKAVDMTPSDETLMVPAKDVAPATETEVTLTKDMEPLTKLDVALAKDMELSTDSNMTLVKDMAVEPEEAAVQDVILPTEKDVPSTKGMGLPTEIEIAPAKDVILFSETEKAPPIEMDLTPAEGMMPPTDKEMVPAMGVLSLSEIDVALAKDVISYTEKSLGKEATLSSETEVALSGDVVLSPETKMVLTNDVALPLETEVASVKDMAPSPETEVTPVKDMTPLPKTEVTPVKDMAPPPEMEVTPVKDMTPSLEMTLGKDVVLSPETEIALAKDVPLPPKTEITLPKDMPLSPGTEMSLDNNVTLAKDVALPSETEVASVPVKDVKVARNVEEISEDSQLESLQQKGQSAAPASVISPEPVTSVGQKYNLPVSEDSVLEKPEQEKPSSSQLSEHSSETSGTPPTQAKQACRPSDRKSSRPRPARIRPEQLGGSSPWKTFDPGLGSCSLSELGWVSGSSSCGESGNQRKTIHADSLEPQRDLGRETWDIESTPVLMKKKKKKPKPKRYPQPPVGGPRDDENAEKPQGHPFVTDLQKSSALLSHFTTVGTECGLVSREILKNECEINSKAAKLVADNFALESLSVPLCPLEELPKTAVNSQSNLRVEADLKSNKSVPQSLDRKSSQQDDYKLQPDPSDESQTSGSLNLKSSLMEVSSGKVETPLEIRHKDDCSSILDQETMGGVSNPIAAKELPNLIPTLTASHPLDRSLKEGNDESKMTAKLLNDKQNEFSKVAEDVKELKKKVFPKQNQEISMFASQQQDKVFIQVPELGNEPFKRMTGDGKSRKGRGSAGKMRASSGKGRARSEQPFLIDSQKDSRAVIVPSEPAPKNETVVTGHEREEVGLAFSGQPGAKPDLTEAVVIGDPKETTDPRVAGTLQVLIPIGSGSGMTQTFGAKKEGGTVARNMGFGYQSKEGKVPSVDHEAAHWIFEKPKKRGNEGKNKRFKNNSSTQQERLESKEEILNSPCEEKDRDAGSTHHQNKELELTFSINHDPLLSHRSDPPTVEVVERKGRSSFELGPFGQNKTVTVKDSAITESATKVTDVSCQEQVQGVGFVPSLLSEENQTDIAKGHTAVAAKPNKRSNDGKSKRVKNSFPEKHILENKIDATKMHVPMETTGDHRIEGMGYVDENRNITFTCPRTPPELMGESAPLETLESAACEKLPAPQVVKETDSLPDSLAESRQETDLAQISKLSVVDNYSNEGTPDQERPRAPSVIMPSTSTGVDLSFTAAAVETANNQRNNCLKNKVEFAEPKKKEAAIDGGHANGETQSVTSGTCNHSIEKITELNKGHILSGVPIEDQSLPGEVKALEVYADRTNFPINPVNKNKESEEGSALVQISDLLGNKAQKSSFCKDQNAEDRDSTGLDNLNTKVDVTILPPKNEKDKLEEVSLASENTELECVSLTTREFTSDFLDDKVEAAPSKAVDKLIMTASKGFQPSEPKVKILEAPEKMTEKSEPKALGERKKEDKSRTAEPMKGYMRPTKSRGLTPLLPKSTSQEGERFRQLKSSGMNLPCGDVCAMAFELAS